GGPRHPRYPRLPPRVVERRRPDLVVEQQPDAGATAVAHAHQHVGNAISHDVDLAVRHGLLTRYDSDPVAVPPCTASHQIHATHGRHIFTDRLDCQYVWRCFPTDRLGWSRATHDHTAATRPDERASHRHHRRLTRRVPR